ncbi:restriction endonuclease subunit S [Neisseria sp. HMSC074B07]|uniref:restriction endonuclease subunit S n=1 Tax=Neisseria sp. HMSC074B07 TaxID=1715205 RepID=UPI0008A1956D|nr:restriction endonuclease subunit S [Neisseria sp. HMSC074B07]
MEKIKFSDLYTISSGISSTKEQAGHGSPFLSFSTVFNNFFIPDKLEDLMDTSESEQKTYSIKSGDIFLTRTSEVIDELAMSSVALKDYPNATYSGFLKRLRPIDGLKTYPKFMAFYLRTPLFRKTITNNATMTLRASFNETIFSYLDLLLPDYSEQKKIGDFLYLINQKIALNKQINARLEEMAKTLYDYWFVQFDFPDANGKPYKSSGGEMVFDETLKREIPKGWEVKSFGEVVTHSTTGLNPRDNFSLGNGENFYVTIKNIKDNEIKFHTCAKITDEALNVINKRSKLDKGDILFTSIEPIGSTYLLHEKPKNWDINESVFSIRSKSDFITPYFLFMLLSSDEIKSFTRQVSTGSVHKGIRHESLKRFTFAYSGIDLIKNFTNLISPMQQNIFFLQKQNHHLTQLRDFLLPMLMNGQVSVAE